jgi:hypothetical protein
MLVVMRVVAPISASNDVDAVKAKKPAAQAAAPVPASPIYSKMRASSYTSEGGSIPERRKGFNGGSVLFHRRSTGWSPSQGCMHAASLHTEAA